MGIIFLWQFNGDKVFTVWKYIVNTNDQYDA